jgi:cell division topological specificity factor
MGLFTDIYNTVAKFFRQSDEPVAGDASKAVATNRLKLVLMQDRTNLTPKVLEQMRGELVDLLSKYLEMDKDLLELNFEQEGDQVALMLSIPVIRAKDEEEIEEALKAKAEEASGENGEAEEDLEDSDETEECDESEEVCETEEGVNEVEEGEEASKPKRRRSKKVTPPEEMSGEPQEVVEEQQEVVCENHEG